MRRIIVGTFIAMFLLTLWGLLASDVNAAEYIGVKKCKMCHMKQYKSWKETGMARSFDTLKPGTYAEEKKKAGLDPNKDYTTDPNCLKCHTTGYGKPGGFKSMDATPGLAGVQCEVCHGPGSKYITVMKKNRKYKRAEIKAAGLVIPSEDEKGCLECHGGADNPFAKKWNFKEALEKSHKHFPLKYQH